MPQRYWKDAKVCAIYCARLAEYGEIARACPLPITGAI